jgi:hypothetical protein
MNASPAWRLRLLVLVATLLAIPIYFDYLATLLWLVTLLLSMGLLLWGILQPRQGGSAAPAVLTALLGQRAAHQAGKLALLLAQGIRALAGVLLRRLVTYWPRWLTMALVLAALAFVFDYRLPLPDAHPDWQEFPQLTTKHLVVERIPDFDARYGQRYQLPEAFHTGVIDSHRVSAVRVLGYRVTENTFEVGDPKGRLSNSGLSDPTPPAGWCFNQRGRCYMEVNLAGEKGYFKEWYLSYLPPFYFIYQYNQPVTRQDTLFLHLTPDDYRIYIR